MNIKIFSPPDLDVDGLGIFDYDERILDNDEEETLAVLYDRCHFAKCVPNHMALLTR